MTYVSRGDLVEDINIPIFDLLKALGIPMPLLEKRLACVKGSTQPKKT